MICPECGGEAIEVIDVDLERDAWLDRIEAEGLTVDEYVTKCPTVAEHSKAKKVVPHVCG